MPSARVSLSKEALAAVRVTRERLAVELRLDVEDVTPSAAILYLAGRKVKGG